ncbi:hypothetical protein [Haloferula luteola]|nr:hypothetical protein [Haloferula luteola]
MRRHDQGRHLAATVIELDSPPALGVLERAAECLGQRHPLLHAHIRRGADCIAAWHPGSPASLPVRHHPTGDGDLTGLVTRLLRECRIDILQPGPNLELHLATKQDGSAALILIWPHLLFDAVGIDLLLEEFDSPDKSRRQAWGETAPLPGPSQAWKLAKPMVEEMRTFPAWRIRSGHQSRTAGPPAFRLLRFTRAESTLIRHKMNSTAGELLLLPYFAAVAARAVKSVISTRHPREETALLLSLPVQRISDPTKRPLFQNHMTAWSLLLTHEELADLPGATRSLFKKYGSFLRRKLPAAMDALMALMHRCPSRLYLKPASFYLKGEICSLFHSHTGTFPSRVRSVLGCAITHAYHLPTVSSPPGIGIFFSEYDGQIAATLSWRDLSLHSGEIDALEAQLRHDLGLDQTPSPVPTQP